MPLAMWLKTIETKNYRTLESLNLTFAKDYCTISGMNNAGKSGIIRVLSILFGVNEDRFYSEANFDYKEDKTQWVKGEPPIEIHYTFKIDRDEDPALVSFVEKIASKNITTSEAMLRVSYTITSSDEIKIAVNIGGETVDEKSAKEIHRRIRDSNLLFLYNSTDSADVYYLSRGRRKMIYEFVMSSDEKTAIDQASKAIESKLRRLAKDHMMGLSEVLGRLTDKYEIELSPPEGLVSRRMPLGINLRDRNVEVPILDWGSGTQNRTRILMAIL
jgi:AAA15 family ATPase/GTPase